MSIGQYIGLADMGKTLSVSVSADNLVQITDIIRTDIASRCRTGADRACFWASLPDQAEKNILKIKDFMKVFT